jgi:hypothetical protein
MSCPGDRNAVISNETSSIGFVGANSSISNNKTNTVNSNAQYNNNLTQNNPFYTQNKCKKILKTYPSFTPTINSLSTTSSTKGSYSVVYIDGSNFLPPSIGTTYVNFGVYTNLPVIFFSSSYLSFTVPLNAPIGNYSVIVVNVYNGNFSSQVNTSYPGILNYSNSIIYTIT